MSRKLLYITLIAVITIPLTGCNTHFVPPPPAYTLKIQFINYTQAGLPEQDVFIEAGGSEDERASLSGFSDQDCQVTNKFAPGFLQTWMLPPPLSNPCAKQIYVERADPQDALLPSLLAKPVYASTRVRPHDPYRVGVGELAPFLAGDALGFTWGEWLAASGRGIYSVLGEDAHLDLSFEHLIPNASYSLWCGRETSPPDYGLSEAPCGTADGTQNQFRSDAAGKATLSLQLKPLPVSTGKATTIISASYDRVVVTPDGELGGFGLNNHVQLWFAFP